MVTSALYTAFSIVTLYKKYQEYYSFFTTLEHSNLTRPKPNKLHEYLLTNQSKAKGVFKTLSTLKDTLSNQEKLIKRYSIQLQPTQAIQDRIQSTNNVQLLISDTTIEDIRPVIVKVKSHLSSSVREGYEVLASTVTLKASVNENRAREQPVNAAIHRKGLSLFENQVVYVEIRDYRRPPLEPPPDQKQKIKRRQNRRNHNKSIKLVRPANPKLRALISNFFNTFQGINIRKSVYSLDIAGIIKHTEGEHQGHYNILYKLPSTIGAQSRKRPAENLKLRAPVTLHTRFKLARKLVRTVCLLYSSSWLHKNIHAESVIFFPEHISTLQEDRYKIKIKINVSKPILMGYIFSRPDNIIIRMNPPLEPPPLVTPRPDNIYSHNILDKVAIPKQTEDTYISGFTLDHYQHPAKHADPQHLYRHAYNIYSLGILLLEVELWEELINYEELRSDYYPNPEYNEEDHYKRRQWIYQEYLNRLRWAYGDTYTDIILSYLIINSSNNKVGKASERELYTRIIANLEGYQA
ncbi:hypothetical protein P171DRAFT_456862 [Karstenula rhodostoma CBS 690.94]|uniref:Protein kinase domain-containing protein n=1 Tax=Karstenula rhodostoma CBS 690.94 TaxID=1392251 RepID=A0A9P4U951_9PLEO|nr:hypothetical protein P171DRAFT_456862 [Karstenula rhodostoma CBS 690.94]